jgi:hypothetical protein
VERKGGFAGEEFRRVIVLRREENTTGYNSSLNFEERSWQGGDEKVVAWVGCIGELPFCLLSVE